MPTLFPFTAIVGQERLKRALVLNAVSPAIGGVLIRGERGTAKSTAARALAQLLPDIQVVADCPFACDPADTGALCDVCRQRVARGETLPVTTRRVPFVDLPVSATEDRVVGTLDMERAIQAGERRFEPGLLAAAHRGILYIDEVNLLDDHVVDILLDAAAMGVNVVEREGISFSHPARFILIGTMNPEEGELRPQLLDRFALMVPVQGLNDPTERAEVIARRLRYEADPEGFYRQWADEEAQLAERIVQARDRLPTVGYSDADLHAIAGLAASYRVPGHRADLAILKTAIAQAALDGRLTVSRDDIAAAAELALPHRLRQDPLHEAELDGHTIAARLADLESRTAPPRPAPSEGQRPRQPRPASRAADGQGEGDRETPPEAGEPALAPPAVPPPPPRRRGEPEGGAAEEERRVAPWAEFHARRLTTSLDHLSRRAAGRRSLTRTDRKRGRYVASRPASDAADDLALDATLRAAAPHQPRRRSSPPSPRLRGEPEGGQPRPALLLTRADLRRKVRTRRVGNLILFAVDASWSVAAAERMAATKGAVLSLLRDAYQRRDRVGLLVFRRDRADLALPFTNSIERARRALVDLPIGGKTPLPAALLLASLAFETARRVEPGALPLLILLTDGVGNVPLAEGHAVEDEVRVLASRLRRAGVHSVVVDSEGGPDSPAARLADALGGHFLTLPQLRAETLAATVRGEEIGD